MDTKKDTDDTRIALINLNIENMKTTMGEIKQSVKDLSGVYVTQSALKELTDRTERLERSSNLWRFLSPTFAAIVGSIFTFLIIAFLQNAK